jgi:hypothetical protein
MTELDSGPFQDPEDDAREIRVEGVFDSQRPGQI